MRQVILGILLLSYPVLTLAEEVSYPSNQVERPLTLPKEMWEVGAGIGYLKWERSSDNTLYPIFSLRYGISDDLEFYLAGLRYRVINENSTKLAIKGRVAGIGHSSIGGTSLLSEIGFEGKQRIHPRFAILYGVEDYHAYYSETRDKTDIRISLGGLLSFTESLAVEASGTYRRLWGFDDSDARVFTASVYYNFSSSFDILLEGIFSDFSEKEDLRYLSSSFRQAYGIRLNWRFQ